MRNKKILLIVIPIILCVAILGATFATLYFTTDMFKTNQERFAKYFIQNGETFAILKNDNEDEQRNFKTANNYISNGNLSITVENGSNLQEIEAVTQSRHDTMTDRIYSEIAIKNGEADVLKLSYINSDDVYAIKCDDVMANYIGVRNNELKKVASTLGLPEEIAQFLPDSLDLIGLRDIGKITEAQKQHIIDTYTKVILESISKDNYTSLGKTQIVAGGITYATNAYQVSLDENTIKQVIINCLQTLGKDNVTLAIISGKLTVLGLPEEYTDIAKLAEMVNALVTQIQGQSLELSEAIVITVYESKGKTVKTEIKLADGNKITIDQVNNNEKNKKVIVTIERKQDGMIVDAIVPQMTESDLQQSNGMTTQEPENQIDDNTAIAERTGVVTVTQLTLQKIVTDNNVTNEVEIIPDMTNTAKTVTLSNNVSKVVDNKTSNITDVAISNSIDGINVQTIHALYIEDTEKAAQVDEIMELKNSNTVIINNYAKEQLLPFLANLANKAERVMKQKEQQLGIDWEALQPRIESNIEVYENTIE